MERIRRCGLCRESVSLGVGFKVSRVHAKPRVSLLLLLANQDVELSATSPAPCLPAFSQVSHLDEDRLNISEGEPTPIKYFVF